MRYNSIFTLFFLSIFAINFAQDTQELNTAPNFESISNKGKFFVRWGGNRAYYSNSDITFKGENYNFTLSDVKGVDKPKGWHIDYINPSRITIPQTNFRLGYYLNEHYIISVGLDHMKYVVSQPQIATIDGYINFEEGEGDTNYNGVYNNANILLDGIKDENGEYILFEFEHTDGLNFVFGEVTRVDEIGQYFGLNPKTLQINILEGIGAGALYPKTNATVLGKPRNDEFHWSGYGVTAKFGLNLILFKHFQIQTDIKGGYINMPWIVTTSDGDTAEQDFWFFQHNITIGYVFELFNEKKKNKK